MHIYFEDHLSLKMNSEGGTIYNYLLLLINLFFYRKILIWPLQIEKDIYTININAWEVCHDTKQHQHNLIFYKIKYI